METMPPERRRAIRYSFGGVAEVTEMNSGKYLISETRELGQFGCFVKTKAPFSEGASVKLRITYGETLFASSGRVVYVLANRGMGIAFGTVSPQDKAVLTTWLSLSRSASD